MTPLPDKLVVGDTLTNGKTRFRVARVDPHGTKARRPFDEPCYRLEGVIGSVRFTSGTWWTADEISKAGYALEITDETAAPGINALTLACKKQAEGESDA